MEQSKHLKEATIITGELISITIAFLFVTPIPAIIYSVADLSHLDAVTVSTIKFSWITSVETTCGSFVTPVRTISFVIASLVYGNALSSIAGKLSCAVATFKNKLNVIFESLILNQLESVLLLQKLHYRVFQTLPLHIETSSSLLS